MNDQLLTVTNLGIDFVNDNAITKAVQNISFYLQRKEMLAIVGESGSGKSVTALSIMQLLKSSSVKYSSGSILFNKGNGNSVDILNTSQADMKKVRGKDIAMIFQEPMTSLNPVLTCGEQVMEAMMAHSKTSAHTARRKILDLFSKVKLPDPSSAFKKYPHQLSGGQKQRVMIAMAICCEPSILICDEPTTALDVTVQRAILDLIGELQTELKMGVILITHDLGVVSAIADRIIVMFKGKIVEQGNTATVLESPQNPYTKALLNCRPSLHQKGERLPVVSDFMEIGPTGEIISKSQHQSINKEIQRDAFREKNHEPFISVQNVSVWYPVKKTFFGKPDFFKAVNDISFDIYPGETVGLVGESGSGKTTLGRAVLQLIKPTLGKVFLEGQDITIIDEHDMRILRRKLQIIFQDPYSSLNPRKTIGAAIEEPFTVHQLAKTFQERKEKVIALMEKVQLNPNHYNRYPHEFSGGQRQRIVIARALALNPSFIVCDESVSALDVSVQAQVLNLLNDLKKEFKFTILFISHDLAVVKYISDRIMVMQHGKLEEMGDAEEIYNHPKSDYTKKLVASIVEKLPIS